MNGEIRCANCGLLFTPQTEDLELCPFCDSASGANLSGSGVTTSKMANDKTPLQIAAEKAISRHKNIRSAARALGINHGILIMARDGKEIPAAYKALSVRKSDRYRLHCECGRGEAGAEKKRQVESWLDRNGWRNLTEAVDSLMEE